MSSNPSIKRIQLSKCICLGVFFMKDVVSQKLPMTSRTGTGKKSIEERAIKLAQYIIDTKDTVRGAAKKFGVSKSTVHKDVSQRLLNINYTLAMQVRKVLDENKAERHIRGGMATKMKYRNKSNASKNEKIHLLKNRGVFL